MDYYISQLVRALWLVHFAGYISLYGLLNSKVCFDCQYVSWRKIWNRFQENYASEKNKAKLPNFPVGVLEFFWRRQVANKERWPSTMKTKYSKGRQILWKDKIYVERVWRVLRTAGWWKYYGHTCCIVLRFDAHQSSMAILLELKSFPLLF